MGLAATQARFLELTARKTNVEFQGQQINQQRTTLANKTSAYNTQLLSLKVPTPPSSGDYTTTSYSWTDSSGTENTIDPSSIVPVSDDDTGTKYNISYSYSDTVNSAYQSDSDATDKVKRTEVSPATTPASYTYSINGTNLQVLDEDDDEDKLATLRAATSNDSSSEKFYSYTSTDADGNKSVSYYSASEIEDADTNWNESGKATVNKYLIGNHTEEKQEDAVVTLEMNDSGRMTNITLNGKTYSVSTTTSTDDAAYEDAMNDYTYDEAEYEKELNDINAKLDIVQQQDKSLELQLKAVDTEQEAISTEMDAVKKVADKNIEGTFKTFG